MQKQKRNNNRSSRIASNIQRAVAEILLTEFRDDAIVARVSISDVVDGVGFIKLFYHVSIPTLGGVAPAAPRGVIDQTQKRLDEITPMVRFHMAQKIEQKYVPNIRFIYDDTLEKANRIDELLNNIKGDL
ncbi:MAG: 30S ribosome-binding factor RbfA [Alphaproteobacteria bacterium]|nr:30S ribosome-binding factor RbfA [Alphaproteobacteria bacterium]